MIVRFQAKNGEIDLTQTQKDRLKKFLLENDGDWFYIERVKDANSKRTSSQNNAIHLWLTQLANELDKEGHTIQDVVKAIRRAEIRPTMEALKEVIWKPIQWIMFKVSSSKNLEKTQVDKVYEVANKFTADNFQISIPFPSQEELAKQDDTFIKS